MLQLQPTPAAADHGVVALRISGGAGADGLQRVCPGPGRSDGADARRRAAAAAAGRASAADVRGDAGLWLGAGPGCDDRSRLFFLLHAQLPAALPAEVRRPRLRRPGDDVRRLAGCGCDDWTCGQWYGSLLALGLTRDKGNKLWTSYESGMESCQIMNTQDASAGWGWGGQAHHRPHLLLQSMGVGGNLLVDKRHDGKLVRFRPRRLRQQPAEHRPGVLRRPAGGKLVRRLAPTHAEPRSTKSTTSRSTSSATASSASAAAAR